MMVKFEFKDPLNEKFVGLLNAFEKIMRTRGGFAFELVILGCACFDTTISTLVDTSDTCTVHEL
jgi:hypothetical protein